jgi:hypothetical protein
MLLLDENQENDSALFPKKFNKAGAAPAVKPKQE